MRVEFFGIARARAGTDGVDVEAERLGDALRLLVETFPALDGELEHLRFNLNGDRFVSDPALPLGPGDTLVVMGAQAGG